MTLFASVLHLDRKAVKALRITDSYSLHRVVYSLYADVRDAEAKLGSQPSGILYADQGGDHQGRKILMLADRAPADAVDGQYGEVLSKPIPESFLDHGNYRFKVIINPTRRDSASRKLIPVRGREAIAEWFLQRAEQSWGFRPVNESLQIDRVEVLTFKDKHQRPVTIAQAHVQGVLTVQDPARFQQSFSSGIGRARAYGCGLLQIVPVIDNPFA
ncbi:type I-E CRISPR-associated protein Cas6/Cse3/CasE [Pseudomonas saliphila]|uniref:type I-E CRISPR-associated protein Cas6/Cse3/CasE n=1 Tax=Pseudomonas saliphila TaxID=2586906 RepID=UPI00123A2279|nr:type I-E CRISPR-associated protein Cas6/Cse3/CasE [Pseudomonas saliphila]